MKQKTIHIISHTHWDREWYMPYENHHMLLIELMDKLLDTFEQDPEYRYFHLDGQTIILEDYLQVRPEKRSRLEHYIREGRIHIGPWYVLQDEFLTSSEANIRNLLAGHQDAKPYGQLSKIGYFPDSFGNMGQAPQILRQAGIDVAVFGRGVKPTGFNNTVVDSDSYESPYSEMVWQSPDGSEVLGILFANWYCNGMEVPTKREDAEVYWRRKIAAAESFASTNQLLFMNGCDHQPIQTDLSEGIRIARELLPDYDVVHSNFDDYVASVREVLPVDLVTIKGELRSQHTDGWGTLVNTASARIYLKQMNQRCQTLLEKVAEPLAVFAHLAAGKEYPHHLFTYAWKTLMQNHPHDSICGCSVDEVHREMVMRFDKSYQATNFIVSESLNMLAKQIDTVSVKAWGRGAVPFAVFNTSGWQRSGVVTVELVVDKKYFPEGPSPAALAEDLEQVSYQSYRVLDDQGRYIPAGIEDLGIHFGYELPKSRFRQPYMARHVRLTFKVDQVPACGYQSYAWVPDVEIADKGYLKTTSLTVSDRMMENAYIRVEIANDGTVCITDRTTGHSFEGLCAYENTGDIGNEYVYRQPPGEVPLSTKGLQAEVRLIEQSPYRAIIEVMHHWEAPVQAGAEFEEEKRNLVWFTDRKAQRVTETVPMTIRTQYVLEEEARGLKVRTSFNNQAKDHRLRVIIPTGVECDEHTVDSIFEIARRSNTPAKEWVNPSNCQHQQAFVSLTDGNIGLTVANLGLNEYEVLRDGSNSIAITLLRAVSELGDWGVFPTPEAQCLGDHTVEFAIYPHAGDGIQSSTYAEAYMYPIPWSFVQVDVQIGLLPSTYQWLNWTGDKLAFSTLKMSQDNGDVIARWYNMSNVTDELIVSSALGIKDVYESDVLERRGEQLAFKPEDNGPQSIRTEVGGHQIFTLALSVK